MMVVLSNLCGHPVTYYDWKLEANGNCSGPGNLPCRSLHPDHRPVARPTETLRPNPLPIRSDMICDECERNEEVTRTLKETLKWNPQYVIEDDPWSEKTCRQLWNLKFVVSVAPGQDYPAHRVLHP